MSAASRRRMLRNAREWNTELRRAIASEKRHAKRLAGWHLWATSKAAKHRVPFAAWIDFMFGLATPSRGGE